MRLVFAGTPDAAVPSLKALLCSRHEVVGVVTRPDARGGRGRRLRPSPVADVAADQHLEVLKPDRPGDADFIARLREIDPDLCPVVAYGGLLPARALSIPRRGWVNLHFSVLPAWRGAAPVQRAIMAGDEVTGATTFRIVEALDAGPTYGVVTETIRADDTAGALLLRLAEHGADLLVTTIDGIDAGAVEEREQPMSGVSQAPKLTVDEAEVRWGAPAFAIDRQVRGCTPEPGAWTLLGDERLKVGPVALRADVVDLAPGALRIDKTAVLAGTATHAVELSDVQPPGKASIRAADWARGRRGGPARLGR